MIVTSFLPLSSWIVACDVVLGLGVLADFAGRLRSAARGARVLRFSTWTDVVAIASFLAPMFVQGVGFLRILRTLRLLRTYQLLDGCARTAPSSGATKRPSWPPPT